MTRKLWLILPLATIALGFALLSPLRTPAPAPQADLPIAIEPEAKPIQSPTSTAISTTSKTKTKVETKAGVTPSFQKRLQEISSGLPRVSDLRSLPDKEVHHTPGILLEAGEKMGEVAEALEADPSLKPQGIAFYRDCAKRSDLATSVRALCLHNWEDLTRGDDEAPQPGDVPEDIRALAARLR